MDKIHIMIDDISDERPTLWDFNDNDEDDAERERLYAAARRLHQSGYNVVPQALNGEKHPAVKWAEYQDRRITNEELEKWYPLFERGVGLITGAVSGVIVVESDGPEGEALLQEYEALYGALPETRTIHSGSRRGFHRYFRHPGYPVKTIANPSIKLDIKGDGGFVLAPPSWHKSGHRYEVVNDVEPADLPDGLLDFIALKAQEANAAEASSGSDSKAQSLKVTVDNFLGEMPAYLRDGSLKPNIFPVSDLPPLPAEEMAEMLKHLASKKYFERRDEWMKAGMALRPVYGDDEGPQLWALTHNSPQAITDAPAQWASFSAVPKAGGVSIGSLIKAARDTGFNAIFSAASGTSNGVPKFTGQGGDVLNGKRLAAHIGGRLLHIHETGNWLQYSPARGWTHAAPGEAERAAKEVLAQLRAEAAEAYRFAPDDPKTKALMRHVDRTSQAAQIRAMIEMAKSEPGVTARLSDFDIDDMLIGVANGVLDLRTGLVLPPSPEILVSKRCNVPFDPDAQCPRFEKFMAEIQPDAEVQDFLQRWIGYSLTGLTSEQKFAFFYGSGANGKSVFIETIAWLLGDYAHKMPTEALMSYQRNPQGPSPEIVALKGVRYAYANETVEGRRLDEARVKDLTGGDTLTGRAPYGKAAISFQPSLKLSVAGNHKPEISDASFGMWRRVMLVPFEETIPEAQRDPRLFEKLKEEGSGILNWALQGLHAWQKSGLQVPKGIASATAAYRDEQDILLEWLNEACTFGAGLDEPKANLYVSYTYWCSQNGHKALAQGRLTRRLKDRGYKLAPDHRRILGLALKPSVP